MRERGADLLESANSGDLFSNCLEDETPDVLTALGGVLTDCRFQIRRKIKRHAHHAPR
jgi:hypothetical protein